MKEKELYLLTKVDFAGNVLEPSLRFRCVPTKRQLLALLGELTNFAPVRRDGSPNPDVLPTVAEEDPEPSLVLEWDPFCNDGVPANEAEGCSAFFSRSDILPFYYHLENLDRIRGNRHYLEGEAVLIGSEDGCVDVEV